MLTQIYTGELVVVTCGECGITFGMDQNFYDRKRKDHSVWYCPNGHNRVYNAKTQLEKEKEELEYRVSNLHSVLESKNSTIHSLKYSNRALKAAKTKIINRVKNGVCPCCNRTFANLQNHFKTVHPELLTQK